MKKYLLEMALIDYWRIYCNSNSDDAERQNVVALLHQKLAAKLSRKLSERFVGNREVAEDCVSELFVRLLGNNYPKKEFESDQALESYLYSTVKNSMNNELSKINRTYSLDSDSEFVSSIDDPVMEIRNTSKEIMGFGFDNLFQRFKDINKSCYVLLYRKYYSEKGNRLKGITYKRMIDTWEEYKKLNIALLKARVHTCYNDLRSFLTKNRYS